MSLQTISFSVVDSFQVHLEPALVCGKFESELFLSFVQITAETFRINFKKNEYIDLSHNKKILSTHISVTHLDQL